MPQRSVLIITGGLYLDFPAMAAFLKKLPTKHGFQAHTTEDRDALIKACPKVTTRPSWCVYRGGQGVSVRGEA